MAWGLALGIGLVSIAVIGTLAYLEGWRPFLSPGADPTEHQFRGAGGDPRLLRALADAGVELRSIGEVALEELRSALERVAPDRAADVVILRGRVINNVTRRGVAGFLVTPRSHPAAGGSASASILRSALGDELAPAITDRAGRYTLVGLPRGVELTNVLERPGFLELAYTARVTYPGDYLQEYVGTVPASLARPAYTGDPDRPFAASRSGADGRGEIALTVVFEPSPPEADDHGFVTGGKYDGGGVPGARFRVWSVPAEGDQATARSPVAGPDGIVYADSLAGLLDRRVGSWTRGPVRLLRGLGMGRLMDRFELPAPDRTETSSLGLALVRSLPAGLYDVEAEHPSLRCLPTRDAWLGAGSRTARVEIVEGTLGDVRFYCLPPGSRRGGVEEGPPPIDCDSP